MRLLNRGVNLEYEIIAMVVNRVYNRLVRQRRRSPCLEWKVQCPALHSVWNWKKLARFTDEFLPKIRASVWWSDLNVAPDEFSILVARLRCFVSQTE